MPPSLLPLVLTPRETLLAFEYISANPTANAASAKRALHVGINTWYGSLRQLEGLGLIAPERAPGGKKVRRYHVTPQGQLVLEMLGRLEALVAESPAALLLELKERPPPSRSARAGDVLCLLIEAAERRMDWKAVKEVEKLSQRFHRPAEGYIARAVVAWQHGNAKEAEEDASAAVAILKGDRTSRSYRRALYVHAAVLEMLGAATASFRANLELRKLSREAKDASMEAGACLSIGVVKGRLGQLQDSARYLHQGAEVARKAGLKADEAKILLNLGFTQFFFDLDAAIKSNDAAIQAARVSGVRLILATGHLNRALYLAAKGEKAEGWASFRIAEHEQREAGGERGELARQEFLRLIRRTLRRPHAPNLPDLRDQVLQSAKILPLRPPEGPRGSRSGRGRSR